MRNLTKPIIWIILILFSSCSILDVEEDGRNIAVHDQIDFLIGAEQSGLIKRETHFSNTDDVTVDSDIMFYYKNGEVVKKVHTNYNTDEPCILQKDSLIYNKGKLQKSLHFSGEGASTGDLTPFEVKKYYYPDINTKIKVRIADNGEIDDSVKFIYDGDLIIEERHFYKNRSWGSKYQYNNDGKISRSSNLKGDMYSVYSYDKDGILENIKEFDGNEQRINYTFEREFRSNRLLIKCYSENVCFEDSEPTLNSIKIYENGKLIESVKHCTSTHGLEWWSTRYEYFD